MDVGAVEKVRRFWYILCVAGAKLRHEVVRCDSWYYAEAGANYERDTVGQRPKRKS